MKLENQVCSLELTKRLKELGVKQESLWWWETDNRKELNLLSQIISEEDMSSIPNKYYYSAFTVAELGEMLPMGCKTFKDLGGWYYQIKAEPMSPFVFKTEANARAKMLIYLKEKGLVK